MSKLIELTSAAWWLGSGDSEDATISISITDVVQQLRKAGLCVTVGEQECLHIERSQKPKVPRPIDWGTALIPNMGRSYLAMKDDIHLISKFLTPLIKNQEQLIHCVKCILEEK